jgi:hypothetical protein
MISILAPKEMHDRHDTVTINSHNGLNAQRRACFRAIASQSNWVIIQDELMTPPTRRRCHTGICLRECRFMYVSQKADYYLQLIESVHRGDN